MDKEYEEYFGSAEDIMISEVAGGMSDECLAILRENEVTDRAVIIQILALALAALAETTGGPEVCKTIRDVAKRAQLSGRLMERDARREQRLGGA